MTVRVIAQAVDSASLLVDNVSRFVTIRKGVVFYVAFLQGCSDDTVRAAVQSLVSTKIFLLGVDRAADEDTKAQGGPRAKPQSLAEAQSDADVLIIPQASLAGRPKGKMVQYHMQCGKEDGLKLYQTFVNAMRSSLLAAEAAQLADVNGMQGPQDVDGRRVYNGTYGNRQALQFASEGPLTHSFEFGTV